MYPLTTGYSCPRIVAVGNFLLINSCTSISIRSNILTSKPGLLIFHSQPVYEKIIPVFKSTTAQQLLRNFPVQPSSLPASETMGFYLYLIISGKVFRGVKSRVTKLLQARGKTELKGFKIL